MPILPQYSLPKSLLAPPSPPQCMSLAASSRTSVSPASASKTIFTNQICRFVFLERSKLFSREWRFNFTIAQFGTSDRDGTTSSLFLLPLAAPIRSTPNCIDHTCPCVKPLGQSYCKIHLNHFKWR